MLKEGSLKGKCNKNLHLAKVLNTPHPLEAHTNTHTQSIYVLEFPRKVKQILAAIKLHLSTFALRLQRSVSR